MPDELMATLAAPSGAGPALSDRSSPTPAPVRGTVAGVSLDAVVVVRDGADWLVACLDGIAAQTLPPERLVIVDLASTDSSGAIATAHQGVRRAVPEVRVLRLDAAAPLGGAIDRGIDELPVTGDPRASWVWVLHHDTLARRTTLARLLEAVLRSPSVGLAGPKVVSAADSRQLVQMGISLTRTGRLIASPAPGEADQGQHDGRTDVLAVGTAGLLLRRSTHTDIGGFDPSFQGDGAALDLGWRAQLADHRVIVVPGAVVRDGSFVEAHGESPPASTVRARRDAASGARRAARQVVLARCSPFAMPFLAIWIALSAVVSALALLVAKRPRQAWRELSDISALAHPVRVLGARWRGRTSKKLRRDDLATLFVTPGAAARTTLDHIQDAVTPERSRPRRESAPATETGPVDDDATSPVALPASLPRRVATHPGFLAVVAVLVGTSVAWRDTIRAGGLSPTNTGLAGGELRAVTTGSSGLWHAFRDAWHGAGLGTGVESGPHLAVLSGLTWLAERVPGVMDGRSSAGVVIAWLLFLAPALSAWSTYLAARVVTSSRWTRAVAALVWGSSTVLTAAVSSGRLTFAVAHILLPFVLAGFVLAARRDGTYTATFATALAVAVLGAFAPPLLVLTSVAALLLLILGPGARRWRGLVLLVVPLALLGPWLARFVDDWRLLLSGPGLVSTAPQTSVVSALLAHPDGGVTQASWLFAPVVVLGVLGYAVRGRNRAENVALAAGAVLAVTGLVLELGASRVVLGSAETGVGVSAPAHLWSGVGLDLWLAGILVGVLVGGRTVLSWLKPQGGRLRGAVAVALIALVALPALAQAARWGAQGLGSRLTVGQATLPAVAVEQGSGPLSNRLLLLRPSDTVTDFVLVGQEPGELLRDLDRPAATDDAALVEAVAEMVGGRSASSLDSAGLARLAIGFVQVRGEADTPLVRRLDAAEGLSRLGTSEHGILWKVAPLAAAAGVTPATAPSRVRIVDAKNALLQAVPTVGPHAAVDGPVASSPVARRLVVAEPAGWAQQALVTWNEVPLVAEPGPDQPTYALPQAAGDLRVDLAAAAPWWRLGQGVLLGFVIFMALPFGNRRSRRRS
ncbi:MAG: glycosyltransferase [Humibacillus sp.]|nr:glycosyltransferase [Humibacillus sp.]MDN5777043.1 glycosyltransferase [Humibacillus sp.]